MKTEAERIEKLKAFVTPARRALFRTITNLQAERDRLRAELDEAVKQRDEWKVCAEVTVQAAGILRQIAAARVVVFLDVDGVLNRHGGPFDPDCIKALNHLLATTGADVVMSSGWRYQILTGKQTVAEFTAMLEEAGVRGLRIIGWTPPDEHVQPREFQILKWLEWRKFSGVSIVIDDLPLSLEPNEERCVVRTDPSVGLTMTQAKAAIQYTESAQLLKQKHSHLCMCNECTPDARR